MTFEQKLKAVLMAGIVLVVFVLMPVAAFVRG